jgi:DNA-binding transcriptional ArsR family regulator
MGEDKTIKVEKTLTIRYNIVSDVIVSPTRLEILNNLIDSPDGLSYSELVNHMPKEEATLKHDLDILVKDNVVENWNGKYILSKNGMDVYYAIGKAAMKVKEEGLLSRYSGTDNTATFEH